jgi:hypothetical protein
MQLVGIDGGFLEEVNGIIFFDIYTAVTNRNILANPGGATR